MSFYLQTTMLVFLSILKVEEFLEIAENAVVQSSELTFVWVSGPEALQTKAAGDRRLQRLLGYRV